MKACVVALLTFCGSIYGYNKFHIELAQSIKYNLNVSRCDFRGAGDIFQKIKVNFVGAQMAGVNFSPCQQESEVSGIICIPGQVTDLSGYNFSKAILISADFQQALLKGADFTGADLMYANFTGADLTGAKLDGALNVTAAIFCNAIMPDGTTCSGENWKSKSGKVILCHCPHKGS